MYYVSETTCPTEYLFNSQPHWFHPVNVFLNVEQLIRAAANGLPFPSLQHQSRKKVEKL